LFSSTQTQAQKKAKAKASKQMYHHSFFAMVKLATNPPKEKGWYYTKLQDL
jgi:hypothetical protein